MKGVDRRKPSKWVATPSNGATAAHTVKRRETLRILTRMSIRPSCGGRCRGLRKPSGGGACSHPHTGRCISAPPRGRFRIARPLFTLFCRRCGPTVSSSPQGGKRVGADTEAPGTWAAHPAGNRTRSRPALSRRHAPPPQAGFLAAVVIGPSIFSGADTPASSPLLSLETELGPFNRLLAGYVP